MVAGGSAPIRRFARRHHRSAGAFLPLAIGLLAASVAGSTSRAAVPQEQSAGNGVAGPIDLSLPPAQDETITVMGHRPFMLAPLPGGSGAAPGWSGIAPGSRLGPFVVTGGPTSGGVSAGLALPIRAVKGLEFDAGVAGSRDALSPAGTVAAAVVTAGFRLKF